MRRVIQKIFKKKTTYIYIQNAYQDTHTLINSVYNFIANYRSSKADLTG